MSGIDVYFDPQGQATGTVDHNVCIGQVSVNPFSLYIF